MTEPASPRILTSSDPQPPIGTIVTDHWGHPWQLDGDEPPTWFRRDVDADPESWIKVAGNYGPVTVVQWGSRPGTIEPTTDTNTLRS
jgi:hypothetical protein